MSLGDGTTVRGDVQSASNVLVLSGPFSPDDACYQLLGPATSETNVLVLGSGGVERRVRRLVDRAGGPVAELRYVALTEVEEAVPDALDDGVALDRAEVVSKKPADLTGLGIEVSKSLSEWEGKDGDTVVCFDSLTTVLQYVDLRTLFRFLHLFTQRVRSVDGVAHYHLDDGVYSQQTVSTLSQLVDAVVKPDER